MEIRKFTDPDAVLNRQEVASLFEVSLPTVDYWIRRGLPYLRRGSNGREWEFRLSYILSWWKDERLTAGKKKAIAKTRDGHL